MSVPALPLPAVFHLRWAALLGNSFPGDFYWPPKTHLCDNTGGPCGYGAIISNDYLMFRNGGNCQAEFSLSPSSDNRKPLESEPAASTGELRERGIGLRNEIQQHGEGPR